MKLLMTMNDIRLDRPTMRIEKYKLENKDNRNLRNRVSMMLMKKMFVLVDRKCIHNLWAL